MSQLRAFCGSNHQIRPTDQFRVWLKCAPFKKESDSNVPLHFFGISSQINLIYALLPRIQLDCDYALFGGHFWLKFSDGGHFWPKFSDRGH